MFLKPLSPAARLLIGFGLTAPSLLVTVACVFTFQDKARMDSAFEWVRHALEVQNRVHQLALDVHEIEAGQHAYLFTGRGSYRDSVYAGQARVSTDLRALRNDVATDGAQRQRFIELQALVLDRLDLARQAVELKKAGQHDAAHSLIRTDRRKNAMERVQTLAEDMCTHEANLLVSRDRALAARRQSHARWLYGLLCLNLSSLACTLFLLHRLEKAESLARVCAWSNRIEHDGQWLSLEEYLNRRFSIDTTHTISPAEVDRFMSDLAVQSPSAEAAVLQPQVINAVKS
jgi:CHASE3 domain sensor protein